MTREQLFDALNFGNFWEAVGQRITSRRQARAAAGGGAGGGLFGLGDFISDSLAPARELFDRALIVGQARAEQGAAGAGGASEIDQTRARLAELTEELRFELDIVNQSNEARQRSRELRELEREAAGLEAEEIAKVTAEYGALLDELQRSEELKGLFDDIGDSTARAFEAFTTGAASAQEALASLARDLQRLLLRTLVLRPLSQGISGGLGSLFGLGNANGNVFGRGGRLVPFASGGIFNSPTAFNIPGTGLGVLGEAGPEAILPLERGEDGRLGVRSGGGGRSVSIGTVNINVSSGSPQDGMRRSSRQLARDARRNLGEL